MVFLKPYIQERALLAMLNQEWQGIISSLFLLVCLFLG